jgi:uncharacterized protein YndB with AHSA1/START domain
MPLQLAHVPSAKTAMLIRRPAKDVFEAFVNPDITTKFWFTKSSGRLEAGKRVVWQWEMYGVSAAVIVKTLEPDARIVVEWEDDRTITEWTFTPHGADTTFVEITHSGFTGDGDAVVARALDSVGGFTWSLAGLKALLEHGIRLNLVGDRFPQASHA